MRITRVARIPIRLHWSFLGFMALYAGWTLVRGGLAELLATVVLLAALFTTVVLHELGHALAARGMGIQTAHITLYPFGGIAALRSMPSDPRKELLIALAGPAVNFALAAVLAVAWLALGGGWSLVAVLLAINLVMGLFNLVPAFPMDGGRVLRALLATRMGWLEGSRVAMRVGRVLAWIFVGVGLVSGTWSLVLVGGFVLLALSAEKRRLAWLAARRDALRPNPPRVQPGYGVRWRLNPPSR